MDKKIIIINGKGKSGKDTFVKMVGKYIKTQNYSSVELIREVAKHLGYDENRKNEKDRKFLSDLKMLSTKYNDAPFNDMILMILNFLYSKDNINELLFIHVREPNEIQRLMNYAKESNICMTTLLIEREELDDVVYGNLADDNVDLYNYDYKISNNGTLEDLEDNAMAYLMHILGDDLNLR